MIASAVAPLPEVSGDAALHADPHNVDSFVKALKQLQDPQILEQIVQKGFKNAVRFERKRITQQFLNLYQ